jgi:titin
MRPVVWLLAAVALPATLLAPVSTASAQSAPAAPTIVSATPGDASITLAWIAGDDWSATVTRYEYTQSDPATNVWIPIPGSNRNTTRYTVTGLDNGTAYRFQLRAVNDAGNGAASTASTAATPSTTPSAPLDLIGTVGNSRVVLTWVAAASDATAINRQNGYSPITRYQYQQKTGDGGYSPWSNIINPDPATAPNAALATHTVTGLTNGITYQFKVRAVNANGNGAAAETAPVTVATTPGRPRSLAAVAGSSQVRLSWTASSDGGSPVTSWQFRLKEGEDEADPGDFTPSDGWVAIPGSGADTSTYTVVSLNDASRYKFQVRAVNALGAGTAAESGVVDPGTTPGMPTGLSGAASQFSVTLTWSPALVTGGTSVDNGGAPILRYEYSVKAGDGDYGEWVAIPDDALFEVPVPVPPADPVVVADVDARTAEVAHTVEDLTEDTPYRFRVRAVNAISPSDHIGFQDDHPVYLGTRPPAPTEFIARPIYNVATGSAHVALSWASGGDGHSPITRWQYRTHTTRAGLNDTSLSSWVDICNSLPAYTGPVPSCRSSTSRVTLPRAPLTRGGTDGPDGSLTFSAGSQHFFMIRAVNAQGNGLQSIASARFPVRVPSAPPAVYIGGTNGTVSTTAIVLNWRASATGGAPILRYEYAVRTGTGLWSDWTSANTGTTLRYQVPTTTPAGSVHTFRIRAVNAEGPGAFALSPAIAPGAPGTPGAADLSVNDAPTLNPSPGLTQIRLTMAGATGNTNARTQWQYSYRVGFGRYSAWTYANTGAEFDSGAINPIDGLLNGVSHTFRIRAVNPGGLAGPELESLSARPGVAPPAPLGLTATPGDQQITLSWTSQGSGGLPITRWQICGGVTPPLGTLLDCNADGDWADIRNSNFLTTSHTIKTLLGTHTPLTNGTSYTFQIRARNPIIGGAPAQTYSATPGKPPNAPSRMQVDPGNNRVTITADAPSQTNGSPVVGYQVRKRRGDGPYEAWEALGTTATPLQTPSAQTGTTVTGLFNGIAYTFQVRAVNAFGPGPEITSEAVTPTGPPIAGQLGAGTGDGQVALYWNLLSSGGSTIVKWQYRQSKSGGGYGAWTDIVGSGPATTSHTATGLSNGISYTFEVRAVNAYGPGPGIASAAVMPSTVPPAPKEAPSKPHEPSDRTAGGTSDGS